MKGFRVPVLSQTSTRGRWGPVIATFLETAPFLAGWIGGAKRKEVSCWPP